ncbi:MAG: hypothetical protein HOG05_06130 [Bacteroidetes bacterium]|nr:hypothetical protein [Bacteroidota bacterium]
MEHKKRRRVITATHRKDSESFPGWMKFEITMENEDGSQETIPAYGKDLQDALNRINHDLRVNKIMRMIKSIPQWIALVLWFAYLGILSAWSNRNDPWHVLIIGIGILLLIGTILTFWFRKRNVIKE